MVPKNAMKKILLLLATTLISKYSNIHAQKLTVHTSSDSTMADYVENTTRTMRGWGEMLQEFLTSMYGLSIMPREEEAHVHSQKKDCGMH